MNLPEITALIGRTEQSTDELAKKVKTVKIPEGDGNNPYAVEMLFDLEKGEITFSNPIPYADELRYQVYYFGNNSAAAAQCYLVRKIDSLHYLLSSTWNDLYLVLQQNEMSDSGLARQLLRMQEAGLIVLGTKKGSGSVALEKITVLKQYDGANLTLAKAGVSVQNSEKVEEIKFEELIRRTLDDKNKSNKYILVIPRVAGEGAALSLHPDYLELVKKINKLSGESEDESQESSKICYVCKQMKPGASSSYTKDLSRTGVNKIFATTTINTAKQISQSNYDDNYALCNQCYQDMLNGEEIIKREFTAIIAGERAFILPEGIFGDFDYQYIGALKKSIDFAFETNNAKDWIDKINAEASFLNTQYAFNIIIYRTDGNSVTVLETIADVPLLHFEKLMRLLSQNTLRMGSHLRGMSLRDIHRLIPVKKNKTEQVDVGRVLSLFNVLLTGGKVAPETLFGYASEALDKGMRQLTKSKVDNYYNMGLVYYTNGKEDFFLKKTVMSYLVLLRTCQQLSLLDKPVFDINDEEDESMDEQVTAPNSSVEMVSKMESFLQRQGFSEQAKALFYLGTLINCVALAQYKKEHKQKPILKKIHFQGMKVREVLRLYEEVIEKLRQYNQIKLHTELLMNKFHEYYGGIREETGLSEHENVFYIMAGYSYLVGTRRKEELQAQDELEQVNGDEEENID